MTNRLALILGVIITGLIAYDLMMNDGTGLLFTLRKFLELLEYVAFWR